MSIWRSAITNCYENFLDLIQCQLRRPARLIWLMRALTLRAQARGLSTASKFSPGYCIQKRFPNSRLVTLRLGALRSMTFPRLKTRCHRFGSGQPLQPSPEAIRQRLWSAVRSAAPHRFSYCSASRALTDHLALNAPEMTAVESAVVASLAGAVQNAACYPQRCNRQGYLLALELSPKRGKRGR